MPNAAAAGQALAVLQLHRATPRAGAGRRRSPATSGCPRSSVYHLLAVLRREGFVTHLPEERRYGLGVAAFELGSAYTRQEPLQRIARPVAGPAGRQRPRTTPTWRCCTARDVLYVVEERAAGRPPLVTDVGVRLPAHLTASGLAMLAALPPAQVRALFPSRAAFVQRHGIGPGVAAGAAPGAHAGTTRRLRPRGRLGHPRVRVGGVGRAGPLRPPGRGRRGHLPGARGGRGRTAGRWPRGSAPRPASSPAGSGGRGRRAGGARRPASGGDGARLGSGP